MESTETANSTKVRSFFDGHTDSYDGFYEPRSSIQRVVNRWFRQGVYLRRDKVVDLMKQSACKTILDVGCGSGRNSVWWALHGAEHVHGVDFSYLMINEATQVAVENGVSDRCSFEVGDFQTWQSNSKFDLVAACGVFDYVNNAVDLLRHMSEIPKTKVIYGSFPNANPNSFEVAEVALRRSRMSGTPDDTEDDLHRIFKAVDFGPYTIERVPQGYLAWSEKR